MTTASSVREDAARRREHALETIKKMIWSPAPNATIKPIFVLTVRYIRGGTGRHVRYLVPTGLPGVEALKDVTGYVARALDRKWNDKTGTYYVKGGDGTDALDSLSIDLFGDTRLPYFRI
jgi:hypothetical protein